MTCLGRNVLSWVVQILLSSVLCWYSRSIKCLGIYYIICKMSLLLQALYGVRLDTNRNTCQLFRHEQEQFSIVPKLLKIVLITRANSGSLPNNVNLTNRLHTLPYELIQTLQEMLKQQKGTQRKLSYLHNLSQSRSIQSIGKINERETHKERSSIISEKCEGLWKSKKVGFHTLLPF